MFSILQEDVSNFVVRGVWIGGKWGVQHVRVL